MIKTLGTMIAELRKQHGMTQLELAEKMGVTDKAVSKWERDLSCPDINSLPTLAEILGVSVEELMQIKKRSRSTCKQGVSDHGYCTKGCCHGDGYRCSRIDGSERIRCPIWYGHAGYWPCLCGHLFDA